MNDPTPTALPTHRKRPRRWPLYATFISPVIWAAAVILIHGADELVLRAGMALAVAFYEFLLVGYVSIFYAIITALTEWPARRKYERARRRIIFERCVLCDYSLKGNTSGVCPECGADLALAQEAAVAKPELVDASARWAMAILLAVLAAAVVMGLGSM